MVRCRHCLIGGSTGQIALSFFLVYVLLSLSTVRFQQLLVHQEEQRWPVATDRTALNQSAPKEQRERSRQVLVHDAQLQEKPQKQRPVEQHHRAASNQTPVKKEQQDNNKDNCPQFQPRDMHDATRKPVWLPGYPGSGSELLRDLVKAVTGLKSGNHHEGNKCHPRTTGGKKKSAVGKPAPAAVTCKTHWPLFGDEAPQNLTADFESQFILLLRNPANAMPSFFNWIFEKKNHLKTHSRQAPQMEWQEWRQENFHNNVVLWKRLVLEWNQMTNLTMGSFVPYEALVSPETGVETLQQFTLTLQNITGMEVAPAEMIPCIWRKYSQHGSGHKRAKKHYKPAFSQRQKQELLDMLDEVSAQVPILRHLFETYRMEIINNTRLEEDEDYRAPLLEEEKVPPRKVNKRPINKRPHTLSGEKKGVS